MSDPERKRLASLRAMSWRLEANEWETRAADIAVMYRDEDGAKDALTVAAVIRMAAERLLERTQ